MMEICKAWQQCTHRDAAAPYTSAKTIKKTTTPQQYPQHANTDPPPQTHLESPRGELREVLRHGALAVAPGVLRLVAGGVTVQRRPPLAGGLLGQAGHVLVGERLAPDGPGLGLRVGVDPAVAALGNPAPHQRGREVARGQQAGDGACGDECFEGGGASEESCVMAVGLSSLRVKGGGGRRCQIECRRGGRREDLLKRMCFRC